MYELVYVEFTNEKVATLSIPVESVGEESINVRFENVPNFERATIIAHLSAAQKGQYSAPMYSTSGLPFCVRAVPDIAVGFVTPCPVPIVARVEVLTPVRF